MAKKSTAVEFIEKARLVHGYKYDYSEVCYVNNNTKVVVICKEHGKSEQTPRNHLNTIGCNKCSGKTKLENFEFIAKAKQVHGNKYDYSKVEYVSTYRTVKIVCKEHGEFSQTPSSHLQGKKCAKCAINDRIAKLESHTDEFIIKAIKLHTNRYDYSMVNYTKAKNTVSIICRIHGVFEQKANSHLLGKGCPKCAITGFDKSKPGILYYLKITTDIGQVLYKIGITNRTINERFSLTELSKIEIVKQKVYINGKDAYDWEQKMLKMYKKYKYNGPKILDSGNTELFTEDVLALYYAKVN